MTSLGPRPLALAFALLLAASAAPRTAAAQQGVRDLNPGSWEPLGPTNMNGRIDTIAVAPGRESTVYVGSVAGGVWKTTDSGATWSKLPLPNHLPVRTLAIDPTKVDTIYAGTGSVTDVQVAVAGAGVWKSTDGGLTWAQLSATNNSNFKYVNRMAVHPTNGSVLLVATASGLFRSADGGGSFTVVINDFISDIEIKTTLPDAMVAGSATGAWWSRDGGLTFAPATGLPRQTVMVDLTISRGSTVYASAGDGGGQVFTSEDLGQTYSPGNMTDLGFLGTSNYANSIWVNPADTGVVLIAGEHFIARSLDHGVTWTNLRNALMSPVHAIVPFRSGDWGIWVATDSGLYRHDNLLNAGPASPLTRVAGIGVSQLYAGCAVPFSELVIASGVGIGTARFAGHPDGWVSVTGQAPGRAGGPCAIDELPDANGLMAIYGVEATVLPFAGWLPFRARMNDVGDIIDVTWFAGLPIPASPPSFNVVPRLLLDPNDRSRLFVSIGGVWRLDNARSAPDTAPWTQVYDRDIAAMALSRHGEPERMVVVTSSGGELKYTDDVLASAPVWNGTGIGDLFSPTLIFDYHDPSVVYMTTRDQLWHSLDGGHSFGQMLRPVPGVNLHAFIANPRNGNELIVGSDRGLFTSLDRGASWSTTNQGPNTTPVTDLFWAEYELHVATYGSGVFRTLVDAPPVVSLTSPAEGAVFTAGANITLTADASDPDGPIYDVEYYLSDDTRLGVATTAPYSVTWSKVPAGSYTIIAYAHDGDGIPGHSTARHITVKPAAANRVAAADTYVRDGSNATVNFGGATSLQTRSTTSTGSRRDSYLRFDISGFPTISSAKLSLLARTNDGSAIIVSAYSVSSTSWGEKTITWNTKPSRSSTASASVTVNGSTDRTYTIDLTSYVKSRLVAGAKSISIALHDPSNTSGYTLIHSRESSTGKPTLAIKP
jgi:photosystem II stability/assembly factor-like uncharacterized protein